MSLISRLYDFLNGTPARSGEVDAELNQLVTAHNDHEVMIQALGNSGGSAMTVHRASSDHDGRYYTEPETDALLTALKGVGYTTETLAGLGVLSTSLQSQINNIIATYSTDAERIAAFQEVVNQFKSADQDIINMILAKANIADVYTKVQIDAKEFATANYAARSVTAEKIALQAVGVEHIKTGAVGADQLNPSLLENVVLTLHRGLSDLDHPDSSVMTKHVRTKAITVAKLADDVLAIDTPYTTTFNNNTYSITTRAGYVSGNPLAFVASADSTGAVSLSVDGVVSPLLKANGGSVANLKNNGLYTARKNGSNFTLQGEGGEYGTATPAETLSGYTIGTESGLQNGTLALTGNATDNIVVNGYTYYNNNAKVKRTGALVDRPYAQVASGLWTDGNGTLALSMPVGAYRQEGAMGAGLSCITVNDADFIAGNIKAGKEVLGVVGTLIDGTGMKKIAKGTVALGGNWCDISGLGFTPHIIILRTVQTGSYASLRIVDNIAHGEYVVDNTHATGYYNGSGIYGSLENTGAMNIVYGGFSGKIGLSNPGTLYWTAIGM